jgi:hypothetical protein
MAGEVRRLARLHGPDEALIGARPVSGADPGGSP